MFSIIIPLYNKSPFIQRAIDSILNQTFSDYEIIVVNDGSTDGGEILVQKVYSDPVILINQSNQGVSAARNTGIAKAKYSWIAFLDSDDFWHPSFLFCINEVISNHPELKMIGSSYSNNGLPASIENPKIKFIDKYFDIAISNTLFTSSSTVIHRSFFEKGTPFKAHLSRGEDIDVWFRAFDFFGKAAYIQEPLMYYDLNASSSLKQTLKLSQTIFSEMFQSNYPIHNHKNSWLTFRDKYLLLNLFSFMDTEENFLEGKKLLKKTEKDFLLARVPYLLPFRLIKVFNSIPSLKSALRKYLKFCFRFIYH
ncbi:Glycosyltransferase involved in cell wall bisynthesis [Algoriphagus ornithinivorans]|uniref:Glycosyltransferase involved in cell wall bisynthesis n=1 Tax=Algoriphagus ornithinivorans TaxID=226506 RepID=A0A1I5HID3_9BACT|nr:glycosyltransferase family A protein [Algoriphagus ornithinivorans]SFO47790.1 Glycosyltransferase involved in cell wall bisynthesis [Algoriphagus ornithinivorans]